MLGVVIQTQTSDAANFTETEDEEIRPLSEQGVKVQLTLDRQELQQRARQDLQGLQSNDGMQK